MCSTHTPLGKAELVLLSCCYWWECYLSLHPPTHLPTHPSTHPPIHPPIHPPMHLFIHSFIIYPPIPPPSTYPPSHPSIHSSTQPCCLCTCWSLCSLPSQPVLLTPLPSLVILLIFSKQHQIWLFAFLPYILGIAHHHQPEFVERARANGCPSCSPALGCTWGAHTAHSLPQSLSLIHI